MSRLTRDATAEPTRETKFSSANADGETIHTYLVHLTPAFVNINQRLVDKYIELYLGTLTSICVGKNLKQLSYKLLDLASFFFNSCTYRHKTEGEHVSVQQ